MTCHCRRIRTADTTYFPPKIPMPISVLTDMCCSLLLKGDTFKATLIRKSVRSVVVVWEYLCICSINRDPCYMTCSWMHHVNKYVLGKAMRCIGMLPTILLALLNMFKKYLHFTVLCSDMPNPRYATSESCEHTFGNYRLNTRKFTTLEFVQLNERYDYRLTHIL